MIANVDTESKVEPIETKVAAILGKEYTLFPKVQGEKLETGLKDKVKDVAATKTTAEILVDRDSNRSFSKCNITEQRHPAYSSNSSRNLKENSISSRCKIDKSSSISNKEELNNDESFTPFEDF